MRLCVKYIERKEVSKITLILLPFQEKAFSEKNKHPKDLNKSEKKNMKRRVTALTCLIHLKEEKNSIMMKICKGCGKEFRPATPFIEFCSECLKKDNYKEEDKRKFEDSYQEMCDYCAEIEEANKRMEEY